MSHQTKMAGSRLARVSALLFISAVVLLSGCARAPRAGTPLKPVDESKGDVYIYRNKSEIARAQPFYTSADGHIGPMLENGTYVVLHLDPGKHNIVVSPGPWGFNRGLTIQVKAGERSYYQFDFTPDPEDKLHFEQTILRPHSVETGRADVALLPGVAQRLNDRRSSFRRTSYARLNDEMSLPAVSEKGRETYRKWLDQKLPRAFAISSNGGWTSTWGLSATDAPGISDPATRVMQRCAKWRNVVCQMYAVNTSVVWTPLPAKMIAAERKRRLDARQNTGGEDGMREGTGPAATGEDESQVQSTTQPVSLPSVEPIIIE
ncbi:hypothetical protein PQR63_21690 [Herbaspirillum rhizosphaerae]|uniref:DUF2846 domain-containing protein n=1 Tax=Herbaspirillum rhizosphaerae TaxID=346179 RepID=A0ABW8ZDQ2_9BURK